MKRLTTATVLICVPLLLTLVAVAANACSESPTSPVEPQSEAPVESPTSATPDLESALGDALVQEVLAGLEDPVLADELNDALDALLDLVEQPNSKAYASAFAQVRRLVDQYLSDPSTSGDDQIALSVLDIALLSV